MKNFIKKFTLIVLTLCLILGLSGCNMLTIYTDPSENDGNGGNGGVQTESSFSDGLKFDELSYGNRYDVESVSLNVQDKGSDIALIDAIDKVYSSSVVVRADMANSTTVGVGSGTAIDIDVTYKGENADGEIEVDGEIVDTDNFVYILTCHHVIEYAVEFAVYFPKLVDEQTKVYSYYDYAFGATLLGCDKNSDIAVLRVEVVGYDDFTVDKVNKTPISNEIVKRGQQVFAVGNPGGDLPGTVTAGVISNIEVSVQLENIGEMKLIQTDTALNHGNSGCGLFNLAGQLVGMVNSGNTSQDGIAFAVPVLGDNGVIKVAKSIIETSSSLTIGYLQGRWKLGVTIKQESNYLQTIVKIVGLEDGSAFKKAGAEVDCQIISGKYVKGDITNEKTFSKVSEFSAFVDDMRKDLSIGDKVKFTLARKDSSIFEIEVTILQTIYEMPIESQN